MFKFYGTIVLVIIMTNKEGILRNGLFTVMVLLAALIFSFAIEYVFLAESLISDVFILGVFIIALSTPGYFWSIAASFLSVLAVNFVFTFPYFAFNFFIPANLASAVIMLAVAIMTSTLTKRIRETERTKAEIEREHMRGNLLRAVSHDLRTPLTTIYGSCSTVIENYGSLDDEHKLKLLGDIREDSEWLIRMVENLLSVTRIDGDKVRVEKTDTALEELIDSVLVKFKKRYPGHDVTVIIPDEFVSIPMDPMLIGQVLMNILENAVLHAEGMTELILKVSVEGNDAVFEVSDNGCGIPKEKLPGLFTGYIERTESPADGKRNNMSIGLSVCYAIIRAHGGRIWAENRKSGGASFFFTLETEELGE